MRRTLLQSGIDVDRIRSCSDGNFVLYCQDVVYTVTRRTRCGHHRGQGGNSHATPYDVDVGFHGQGTR